LCPAANSASASDTSLGLAEIVTPGGTVRLSPSATAAPFGAIATSEDGHAQ